MSTQKSPPVKRVVKKRKPRARFSNSWAALGFDVSMSSIAGSVFAYDHTLRKFKGPYDTILRWEKSTNYYDRIEQAARGHDLVFNLLVQLNYSIPMSRVAIAIEEPWSFGHAGKQESGWLKQQAQISGAFMGALLRYGWVNLYEINNSQWRKIVADDLGITTHWTKWGKGPIGKLRAREWAEAKWPELEKYPDLISSNKLGLIPRPETSKAKAVQCDDRYDARAMALWMKNEWSAYLAGQDDTKQH